MSDPDGTGDSPPEGIFLDLSEALAMLATLEDAGALAIESGHLAYVVEVEARTRLVARRLGFDDPSGGPDE